MRTCISHLSYQPECAVCARLNEEDPRDVRIRELEARLAATANPTRSTHAPWALLGCDKHPDRTDLPCYRVRGAWGKVVPEVTLLAQVLLLEAQLRDVDVHVENGRTVTCGQCKETAFNVCTHLAFRELSDALGEAAAMRARFQSLRAFVAERRDVVGIRALLAEMDRLEALGRP